ncbi:MAG: XrtA/PEP-CTERM system exopolysaccharide export protein [Pseudomonadota bacterium]
MPVSPVSKIRLHRGLLIAALAVPLLAACATTPEPAPRAEEAATIVPTYRLGPGDKIELFVWRNPDLSDELLIRPDGRISSQLVNDIAAAGKTPTELAREIEQALAPFVREPLVTVIVKEVALNSAQAVKVLGQATRPTQLRYFTGMTVLDVLVATGGLTEIADGNRAVLTRETARGTETYGLRLDDLVRGGDITADVPVRPGDTIIVPEKFI